MMRQEMKGKVVLVTGANGGLGRFVTQAFLNVAATVVGSSRKIRQEEFEGANFTALPADLSSREGAKALLDEVVMRFGALDVLVHTVGGFAGGQSVADTDDATFQRMLNMNLNSAFHIVCAALPALRRSGSRRILAIGGSVAAEPGAGVGGLQCFKGPFVYAFKDTRFLTGPVGS